METKDILLQLRTEKGLSQEELAGRSLPKSSVSPGRRSPAGKTVFPPIKDIRRQIRLIRITHVRSGSRSRRRNNQRYNSPARRMLRAGLFAVLVGLSGKTAESGRAAAEYTSAWR